MMATSSGRSGCESLHDDDRFKLVMNMCFLHAYRSVVFKAAGPKPDIPPSYTSSRAMGVQGVVSAYSQEACRSFQGKIFAITPLI